jgi:hypothetical protein
LLVAVTAAGAAATVVRQQLVDGSLDFAVARVGETQPLVKLGVLCLTVAFQFGAFRRRHVKVLRRGFFDVERGEICGVLRALVPTRQPVVEAVQAVVHVLQQLGAHQSHLAIRVHRGALKLGAHLGLECIRHEHQRLHFVVELVAAIAAVMKLLLRLLPNELHRRRLP